MTPKQWKRLFYRIMIWVCLLLLFAFFVAVALATWRVFTREGEARQAREDAAKQLHDLDARKAALTESLNKLDTPQGVDEEIRKRYELAKPGEKQIIVIDATVNPKNTTTSRPKSFWEGFLSWLPQ